MPEWLKTLLGQRSLTSYVEEFAPEDAAERAEFGEVDESATWQVSPRYLEEIGWTPGAGFIAADRLRASELHQDLVRRRIADDGTISVCLAIRHSASVDLAGDDPCETFAVPQHAYYDAEFFRFYGHLHGSPGCQVAGTKNSYRFLRDLFTITWQKERHVEDYVAAPTMAPVLRGLLEALFLSTRSIPGLEVLDRNSTWPGFDDPRFLGLLTPAEVSELVPHLGDIERLQAAHELNDRDELFPLFADRVRRAAKQSLALVTLHASL